MEYHILALGDVTSETGVRHLARRLRELKRLCGIDFTVVNGENISGVGLTPEQAEDLFAPAPTSSPSATTPSTAGRSARILTTARIFCGPAICGRVCPAAAGAYLRRRSGRSA